MSSQGTAAIIHKLLEGKAAVDMFQANYVSTDGTVMTVSINGSFFPANPATPFRPQGNESVWIMFVDGVAYMLGPTTPWPGTGTVVSVASSLATLNTDAGQITATYNSTDSLSTGQTVKIYWSDGPHVIGVLASAAPPSAAPAQNTATTSTHIDTFSPIDAGSWSSGSGWWQSEVWASDSTIGAWFYGSKISDTLNGASVSRIQIFVDLQQKFGSNPNFGTHNYSGKQGSPTISSATAVAVNNGWVDLPVSFGSYLANNVGGIGLAHGGFNKFSSLSEDAQSGALRITSVY
jgi:hypothetical protein